MGLPSRRGMFERVLQRVAQRPDALQYALEHSSSR
jgi:hypothetical protein